MNNKGMQITNKGFQIIKGRLGDVSYTAEVMEIMIRIARTSRDMGVTGPGGKGSLIFRKIMI